MRWVLILLVAVAGTGEGHAGLKDRTGAAKSYRATLEQTIVAVSDAFDSWRYHGMLFITNSVQFDFAKGRWSRRPATNLWELSTSNLPGERGLLARWNEQTLPYSAQFLIHAEELATNECKVTVTQFSLRSHTGGKSAYMEDGPCT